MKFEENHEEISENLHKIFYRTMKIFQILYVVVGKKTKKFCTKFFNLFKVEEFKDKKFVLFIIPQVLSKRRQSVRKLSEKLMKFCMNSVKLVKISEHLYDLVKLVKTQKEQIFPSLMSQTPYKLH